jgi:coniferyl-aldehyde dehydrogenase
MTIVWSNEMLRYVGNGTGLRDRLRSTLELQRKAYLANPVPSVAERLRDLRNLRRFVSDNREALIQAVNTDYGCRSRHETLFTEIVPALQGIDYAIRHLRRWMKPQRRHVDLLLFPGARNRVVPQPLGVVGVIVPWNFPINLSLLPLTSIFAAGNRAMVKLSENSRQLAQLLADPYTRILPGREARHLR